MKVAALQDDPTQALLLEQTLLLNGHSCVRFRGGQALMQALRRESFDMLLLDWEVRGIAGRDVLLWIRRALGAALPVMLLSERDDEAHIANCFADGADAFVAKPLRHGELAARVQALARRTAPAAGSGDLVVGVFRFALAERRAYVRNRCVPLAPKEFDLAVLLFRHAGQLVLRQILCERVWRRAVPQTSRTIDSHLSRVRTKLGLWPHNGVRLSAICAVGCRLDLLEPRSLAELRGLSPP